jgi:hypothetical protein
VDPTRSLERARVSALSRVAVALAWAALATAAPALAAPPRLYQDPFRQSPVRGEPDDLLMIAGSGFAEGDVVVYRRLVDTTLPLGLPSSVPQVSTANEGVAPVASYANVPDSLTVHLPSVMLKGHSYALWVLDVAGEWSEGVRINDARPLWITPEVAYRRGSLAGLPRQLKVVGRNLERRPGSVTKVRLRGPATYTRNAHDDGDPGTAIEHYVARIRLPRAMRAGVYTVEVQRDGVSWVALQGQQLTVLQNSGPGPSFSVSSYGCAPNDGSEDAGCVLRAVGDAANAGGGTVRFGPGRWDLIDSSLPGVDPLDGIVLPLGVSLRGAGASATTVMKSTGWNVGPDGALRYRPVFTIQGRNTVRRIRFEDSRSYGPLDYPGPFFQLGKQAAYPDPGPSPVEDVVFTRNVFARPFIAIGDGNLPVRHVYVTHNEFGAFREAVSLGGNRYLLATKFRVDDSIVAYNRFAPGAYLDACAHQGTLASSLGASHRVDFSQNVADGFAPDYLDGSLPGWRAAFFFHNNNNHEMTLVSKNTATCTGDKVGDGEAIGYDLNANTFGFQIAKDVAAATASTVAVSTADGFELRTTQNLNPVPPGYYDEHWVQVANGTGLGQARQIASYAVDLPGQSASFTVSPAWDVTPEPGSSKITVARVYWQVQTVDNTVDLRGCTKNNQNGLRQAGVIGYTGVTVDSAAEGNVQYESDGILLQAAYSSVDEPELGYIPFQEFQYFVEIRGNTMADEFDYDSECSWHGGIGLWHGAATRSSLPMPPSPVVLGYGVSIARNTISRADGIRGGAIVLADTWQEPPGSRMYVNTLIHHNRIADLPLPGPAPTTSLNECDGVTSPCSSGPVRGVGIHVTTPLNYYTVRHGNVFAGVPTPEIDHGTQSVPWP